jgi:hypothetical protein
MRLLICGDRNWTDGNMIASVLRELSPDVVIEGEARGADSLARIEAEKLGIQVLKFPADWNKYHRAAGPIRNAQMLKEGSPDMVVAFHDDLKSSKGTRNMVEISRKAGIPVRVIGHQ